MTQPTLTYGHGWLCDCNAMSGWTETVSGIGGADASMTCLYDDIYDLSVLFDGAGDEYAFYSYPDEGGATNLSLSTLMYTKALIRWKTSAIVNGAGARVVAVFSDASTQDLLESTGIPQFSTSWTVTTATLTTAKILDHIRVYADDYPNTIAAGTFHVYYDFILICKNVFPLPFISDVEEVELSNNIDYGKIPGRVGNRTQYMGSDSPIFRLSGTMDNSFLLGTTTPSWGVPLGRYLIDIWKNAHSEKWQWLASDLINCKVSSPKLNIKKVAGSKTQRLWIYEMRKFDQSSGDDWSGLDWLGIT